MTMHFSPLRCFALLCVCVLQGTAALNIVAIATLGTTSHFIWTNTLVSRLVERGHRIIEVTVKDTEPHPNRTTFVMAGAMYTADSFIDLMESQKGFGLGVGGSMREIVEFYRHIVDGMESKLKSEAFQGLKSHLATTKEKIDLILIDYSQRNALISISHLVGHPPIIAMSPYNMPSAFNAIMGNVQSPSLAPYAILPLSCEMSFRQRISNFFGYVAAYLLEVFYLEPKVDALLRAHFGSGAPSLTDLETNISLALVNTHPTTHCQQPVLPTIVDVGFLHVAPPKSLPKDIQEFLDGATEGAVVVSFGSFIPDHLLPKLQNEMISTFRRMKQRFLWKTAEPPGNLPSNVQAYKWLPQSDVLAHPNVRLLVAHGGTLSMQEAVYHGVPLVLIPFYLDQHSTAARIANLGLGRALLPANLNAQTLQEELETVMGDPTFKKKLDKLSSISRDQPQSPLERAVFWIEFIGRHKGAPHFGVVNRKMSWIQLYSVDVIAILALGITTVVLLIVSLLNFKKSGLGKEKVA